jgi:ribosomal protein L37E
MRRLTRRRAAEPEPAAGPPGAPEAAPAEPAGERSLLADPAHPPSEESTEQLPVTELPPGGRTPEPAAPAVPAGDLPAGVDPAELANVPDSSARRGRLRRRLEFLRSAHELLLRDLGGFIYELHRTARDAEQEGHRHLRATKLARLDAVEAELHALEQRLRDPRPHVIVREPGVGGECHRCGELFGSDAHYCAHCGAPLTENARRARQKEERAQAAEGEAPASEAAAAGAPAAAAARPEAPATSADERHIEDRAAPPGAGLSDRTASPAGAGPTGHEAPPADPGQTAEGALPLDTGRAAEGASPADTGRAAEDASPADTGRASDEAARADTGRTRDEGSPGAPERNGAAPDARTRIRPPGSERPS